MKQEIIERINLLAQEGAPFLFVVNYQGDDAFIQKLSDIDPQECLFNAMIDMGERVVEASDIAFE